MEHALPSPVATALVTTGRGRFTVRIPERETWRLRNLLQRREYGGLPPRVLSAAPVVLDVGANVGVFAAYACLAYRAAAVHSFEPAPATLELLRANAAQFPAVAVHPFGLGRADAQVELYLDRANSGANSVRPRHARNARARVPVPIRHAGAVWDELGLDAVDVLKVDTEGCEVEVLEALGPRLDRVRVVLAEYHTPGDRRRIDALLPRHLLFGTAIHSVRLGVVKYVREDLVG